MAKTVEEYIAGKPAWESELKQLREILAASPLEETVKWGGPCYTCDGKNLIGLGAYKSFVALWFYQGVLLRDPHNVLVNAQEGVTKAMRQWRMTSKADIKPSWIKAYIKEAIQHQKAGNEIKADRSKPLLIPPELQDRLKKSKTVTANFSALKKSLQREYADYISNAKRAETKQRRLDKIMPMIKAGVGLNDRYRS